MGRILDRLDELYAIGATRIGGSPEEDAAHALAAAWLEAAGLTVDTDRAGNTYGRRGRPTVWVGSHLDSVPDGGRFDGALGVVAAIEVAERLDVPVAVVAFRDEERSFAGSLACVAEADLPGAYLELHVEQGPVLERRGQPLGIVTAIFGQAQGDVVFAGHADHAGTTPMAERRDALVEAAGFVLHVREAAASLPEPSRPSAGSRSSPAPATSCPGVSRRRSTRAPPRPSELDALVAAIGFVPGLRTEPVAMGDPPLAALRAALPERPSSSREPVTTRRSSPPPGSPGDALRAQPERRRQPLARRAFERRTTSSSASPALAAALARIAG